MQPIMCLSQVNAKKSRGDTRQYRLTMTLFSLRQCIVSEVHVCSWNNAKENAIVSINVNVQLHSLIKCPTYLYIAANKGYLRIFRVYISRNAADNGKAVLEGVGLTPEAISACFVNNPHNVEEAVQAGLVKWSEGDDCTWQVLIDAMAYAHIGNHHCRGLRKHLLQIH